MIHIITYADWDLEFYNQFTGFVHNFLTWCVQPDFIPEIYLYVWEISLYRKINIYRRNKLPFLLCVFSHCFIVYKSPKLLVSIANLKALCSLFHLLLTLSSESPFLYCHPSCPVTTINSEGQGQEVTMPPPPCLVKPASEMFVLFPTWCKCLSPVFYPSLRCISSSFNLHQVCFTWNLCDV